MTTDLEARERNPSPMATLDDAQKAPELQTPWDDLAMGLFTDLYRRLGHGKGLHELVRSALKAKRYGFSLKRISWKKRTKGFQTAIVKETPSQRDGTVGSVVAGEDDPPR